MAENDGACENKIWISFISPVPFPCKLSFIVTYRRFCLFASNARQIRRYLFGRSERAHPRDPGARELVYLRRRHP